MLNNMTRRNVSGSTNTSTTSKISAKITSKVKSIVHKFEKFGKKQQTKLSTRRASLPKVDIKSLLAKFAPGSPPDFDFESVTTWSPVPSPPPTPESLYYTPSAPPLSSPSPPQLCSPSRSPDLYTPTKSPPRGKPWEVKERNQRRRFGPGKAPVVNPRSAPPPSWPFPPPSSPQYFEEDDSSWLGAHTGFTTPEPTPSPCRLPPPAWPFPPPSRPQYFEEDDASLLGARSGFTTPSPSPARLAPPAVSSNEVWWSARSALPSSSPPRAPSAGGRPAVFRRSPYPRLTSSQVVDDDDDESWLGARSAPATPVLEDDESWLGARSASPPAPLAPSAAGGPPNSPRRSPSARPSARLGFYEDEAPLPTLLPSASPPALVEGEKMTVAQFSRRLLGETRVSRYVSVLEEQQLLRLQATVHVPVTARVPQELELAHPRPVRALDIKAMRRIAAYGL